MREVPELAKAWAQIDITVQKSLPQSAALTAPSSEGAKPSTEQSSSDEGTGGAPSKPPSDEGGA